MKILKLTKENIKLAVKVLKMGGVVVFPTETAYGLAVDATNKEAVEKIYKIKGRSFKKFLPLIASSLCQARSFFRFEAAELGLVRKYWPGDLTLVLRVRDLNRPSPLRETPTGRGAGVYLLKGQKDCAVRVSSYGSARLLARGLGRPITATSANLSDGPVCYSLEEVLKQFEGRKYKPDWILDGGTLKKRKPSTIVRVLDDGGVEVLRQGEVRVNKQ